MVTEHGADLVDGIVDRIDAALSGYETQRAGDWWYPSGSGPDLDVGAMTEAFRRWGAACEEAWAALAQVVADVFGPLADLGELFERPPAANDFRVRWCVWWDFAAEGDVHIWAAEHRPYC